MQVFGRNLQDLVSVLNCIFTFEFEPCSRAKEFTISGEFCTSGLLYKKLLIYEMLSNNWFYFSLSLVFIIYSVSYRGRKEVI